MHAHNCFHNQLIGAHFSIAGGCHQALLQGHKLQCTAIQIFLKNNRQWNNAHISTKDIELFKEIQAQTNIFPVAHANYLINLASPKKEVHQLSVKSLKNELEVCDQLNINYLVVHPGSHLNDSIENGLMRISDAINTVYKEKDYNCTLLLETMAGQGTTLGKTFAELSQILNVINSKNKVGVCLDTCHIFAAGHKFNTLIEYNTLLHDFNKTIGLEKLKVIHMNNSQKECGSYIDRHEHINEGKISLDGFGYFLNDQTLKHIPKILETPKDQGDISDMKNLEILRKLINKK